MKPHDASGYAEERSENLLSEPSARDRLGGISRATLFRIRQRGELASVRIGRRRLYRPADLDDYIDRHREASP